MNLYFTNAKQESRYATSRGQRWKGQLRIRKAQDNPCGNHRVTINHAAQTPSALGWHICPWAATILPVS